MTTSPAPLLARVPTVANEIEVACVPSDASLRAVAVEGAVQDWAAYADLDSGSDTAIAERGIKLDP